MKGSVHIDPDRLGELRELDFAGLWRLQGTRIDTNRLRSVELVQTPCGEAYLKRFLGIQWKNALKLKLSTRPRCRSQADRERRIIRALDDAGFRPPVVLAFGEETRLGIERCSLLLTAPLAGRPLTGMRLESDRDLLGRVASELGRVLAAGIFLPDLGLDHVFLLEDGGGLGLLDFHNARTKPAPSTREIARAIVRFFESPGGAALVRAGAVPAFTRTLLAAAGLEKRLDSVLRVLEHRLAMPADSSGRYEEPGKARAYAARGRNEAEARLLERLLGEVLGGETLGGTLDAPCGTGRMREVLEAHGARWHGLDRARAMLELGPGRIRASVERLPFRERSFETVFSFRFLHHLDPRQQRELVAELARVAGRRIILSAFHPASMHRFAR
ncbi:MAG: methyltransferase domain-containing protein, partial [Planctomycetota bacterium]